MYLQTMFKKFEPSNIIHLIIDDMKQISWWNLDSPTQQID